MVITVTVRNIVNHDLVQLEETSSVRQAAELMVKKDVGSIVISRKGTPFGIVTERDIIRKVVSIGKDPNSVRLATIMSSPLITIDADSSLADATELMLLKKIRRLLVFDNGKIVGIFTQRDLQEKVFNIIIALNQVNASL
jgi:CBS domain-containing protein